VKENENLYTFFAGPLHGKNVNWQKPAKLSNHRKSQNFLYDLFLFVLFVSFRPFQAHPAVLPPAIHPFSPLLSVFVVARPARTPILAATLWLSKNILPRKSTKQGWTLAVQG